MKFLLHIWKKLLGISIILFSIIIIFNEKSTTKMILQKTDEKILSCQREIESLTTQLTVINKHRKKLEENIADQNTELNSEIQDLKLTIKQLKEENSQLNEKITKNSKSIDNQNNDQKNVIERIPVINNNNNDKNDTGEILELKEKNAKQEKEIFELKEQLNQRIKNETLREHSIDQRRPENESIKNNEIDPLLHPNEEHKGYADGENVHFHRKIPSSADLEFSRDRNGKINLPQILAPKVLYEKLKEKQQQKNKEDGKENERMENLKNDGREEVVDYQSIKKPNKEENDYKEMGE